MGSLPNLHPAIVHFPIALVFTAFGLDLAALFLRRQAWLGRAAATLYGLAGIGAFAAYRAGFAAEDSLGRLSAAAQEAVAEHSDAGRWALIFLLGMAVLRGGLAWRERAEERIRLGLPRIALTVLGAVACSVITVTADHGGALVYRFGLAVKSVPLGADTPAVAVPAQGPSASSATGGGAARAGSGDDPGARLHRGNDGSLHWQPLPTDAAAVGTILRPVPGPGEASVAPAPASAGDRGLGLSVQGRAVLVLADDLGDVEVAAELDTAGFAGTVGIVHHLRDAADFDVFSLASSGRAELVDVRAGHGQPLDGRAVRVPSGRVRLRVSVAGRHLKGMLADEVVAHGHLDPPPPGACGLLLDGHGTVRVVEMSVTPLKQGH